MAVSRLQSILALTSAVVAVGGVAWWAAVHGRSNGQTGTVVLPPNYQVPPVNSNQPTAVSPLALSNPGSQVLFSFAPGPAVAAAGGLPTAQAPGAAQGAPASGYASADAVTAPCNCPDARTQAFGSVAAAGQALGNVMDFIAAQVPAMYADAVGPSLTASLTAANDQRSSLLAITNAA